MKDCKRVSNHCHYIQQTFRFSNRIAMAEKMDIGFRHTCEQHEGMVGYGWDEYDVRHGGHQTIHDAGNSIDITTEFVKIPGGDHGGSWGVRVKGTPREDAPDRLISTVMFYAGIEGLGSLEVQNAPDELGIEGDVNLAGSSNELGEFGISVTESVDNRHPPKIHPSYDGKPLDRTIVSSAQVPEGSLWQAKCELERHVTSWTFQLMLDLLD